MEMSLRKMGLFQLTVCHLISTGKTETITDIETHICNENVVEYLIEKYMDSFFDQQIGLDEYAKPLNKYFSDYDGYIQGNEARKYGIMNEDDGLLLILALISEKISRESSKWTIEC